MTDDLKGTIFNSRYTLLEKIGVGGMATVYRARDSSSSTLVAVKILSREFLARAPKEAERNLRRFKREAEILKLLQGAPHVVEVIEHACSESGDWFIAMELLDGEQLRHYIGRGRTVMGIPTFVHFAVHLIEGLKEVHAKNVLHRDLAPDNVIVVKDQQGLPIPRYLDFGIGKSTDGGLDQVTQMLTIMGKPQYFSPEQARGLDLTPASDVYSIGVLLYEMVTGYVPLEIHGVPDFRKIQKEPPIPITNYKEGQRLPPDVANLIMRCLAKAPEERPLLDELLAAFNKLREKVNAGEIFSTVTSTRPTADHTAPVKLADVELKPGECVGRYEVKSMLGRGGMGAVYLAWDPVLHREIAIKVATRIEEEKAKKALLREARASSALRSENIVTIFDAGTEGGTPYIAMEYVNGTTLSEVLEDGPLDSERFWEMARGICEGLRYAHEQANPVVHRDLKPANILVDRQSVKIADFGIAKITNEALSAAAAPASVDTGATQLGDTVGTVATMSPEQGEGKTVDARSDLYSLGCVLYMMVAGRAPFTGNQIAILYQHSAVKPEPPTKHNPKFEAKAVDAVILKCLEKKPEDRYRSAGEVLMALSAIFAPTTLDRRAWFKTPVGITSIVASVLAVAAMLFVVFRGDKAGPPPVEFAVNFVGINLPEGRFDPSRNKPYFVREPELKVWSRAKADAIVKLTAKNLVTGKTTEKSVVSVNNEANDTLPLPVERGTPKATIEVSVVELDGEAATSFPVIYDGVDPVVHYKTSHDPDWIPLDSRLNVLRSTDLRFRITDAEGSGFVNESGEQVSEVELELGGRFGASVDITPEGDNVIIRALDAAGRGQQQKTPVVREVLNLQFVSTKFITNTPEIDIPVILSVESERFDLVRFPITQDLEAYVLGDGSEYKVPLKIDDAGHYRGALRLPSHSSPAVSKHVVRVRYLGVDIGNGNSANSKEVRYDDQPPVLHLSYQRPGTPAIVWRSDESPPNHPIVIQQGETLADLVQVRAEDGDGGFGINAVLDATFGLRKQRIELSTPQSFKALPAVDLPAGAKGIPTELSISDEAGNTARLAFTIEVLGIQLSDFAANTKVVRSGTLDVRDAKNVEISAQVQNLGASEKLWLEVKDGDSPLFPRLEMKRVGDRCTATVPDLKDRGVGAEERRVLVYLQQEGGTPVTTEIRLRLDTLKPVVSVEERGRGAPSEATIVRGRMPTIEFVVEDAIEAIVDSFEVQRTPESLPKLITKQEVLLEGRRLRIVVTPPEESAKDGTYTLTLKSRDAAGNVAAPRTLIVQLAAPRPILRGLGNVVVTKKGQFFDRALPTGTRRPTIAVRNDAGVGTYRVVATILEEGQPDPTERVLEGELREGVEFVSQLPELPGTKGRVALALCEVGTATEDKYEAFEKFSYLIDLTEPTLEILVGGEVRTESLRAMADEGLRVISLEAVTIRVRDEGGFGPDPVTSKDAFPLKISAREENEIRLSVEPDATWQRKEIKFTVTDLALNNLRIELQLLRAKDRPDLKLISNSQGGSLQAVESLKWMSQDTTIVLNYRNDAVLVTGIRLRVRDANGSQLLDESMEPTPGGFQLKVTLPSEGRFDLAAHALTKGVGLDSSPFETNQVVVDRTPPAISAPLNLTLTNSDEFRCQASDVNGVSRVEASNNNQGRRALESVGTDTWKLPTNFLAGAGTYDLNIFATDRAGNEAQTRSSITIKANDSVTVVPILVAFSKSDVETKTGLRLVLIRDPTGRASDFYISETEVTVASFERFKRDWDASGDALRKRFKDGVDGKRFTAREIEQLAESIQVAYRDSMARGLGGTYPMRHVTCNVAWAYSIWADGRLPKPDEWKGAAGRYLLPDASYVVFLKDGSPIGEITYLKGASTRANCKKGGKEGNPMQVEELSKDGAFGLRGMAGNVSEWVSESSSSEGTLGGSFKWDVDDPTRSAKIDNERRPKNEPGTNPALLQDVGFRVVWPVR